MAKVLHSKIWNNKPVETKAGQFLENDLHDNRRAGQDCRSHPRGHEPQGL